MNLLKILEFEDKLKEIFIIGCKYNLISNKKLYVSK